jgi:hypothetical protein
MGWQTMSSSRSEVSARLSLALVGPEQTLVPLTASLSYCCADPYAVRVAFKVCTDEPVEWIFARDLLTAALDSREGIGDVQAWPSAASCDPAAGKAQEGVAAGHSILNIAISSPFGQAQFELSAGAMAEFLRRTYEVVPAGQESGYLNFDAELAELLSQA